MPRIIETTVYTIDELSDEAKEAARCWYCQQGLYDEWYDFVYEDFETICRILGVTLATSPVQLYGGGIRDKPRIMFSGFANQGDGACYAKGGIMRGRQRMMLFWGRFPSIQLRITPRKQATMMTGAPGLPSAWRSGHRAP